MYNCHREKEQRQELRLVAWTHNYTLIKAMGGHSDEFDTFGTYGHELNGEAEITANLVNENLSKIIKGVKSGVNLEK